MTMADHQVRLAVYALLALYFVGLVFFIAGFSSAHWTDTETYHAGLWSECSRAGVSGIWECANISNYEGWLATVMAFSIMALVFAIIGGATYMFLPVTSAFQISCGGFTFLATVIYGGYQHENGFLDTRFLGWSYALILTGGMCILANGITLAVLACKDSCSMEKVEPPDYNNVYPSERPRPKTFS